MYWLCMIATIPLATGNKLNCFISARGMLAIVWHCVLLFCCFFCVCFFVDFLHVNKSSSQKKTISVDRLKPAKVSPQTQTRAGRIVNEPDRWHY